MLKLAFIFLLPLISSAFVFSQNGVSDFGQVTIDDLKMKIHSFDTSAAAIILFDKAEVEVDPKYSIVGTSLKRHLRIKLFKKSAFKEWADLKLIIDKGGLSNIEGATYNLENGKITTSELSKSSVYKNNLTKFTQQVSFSFPNVREGSIIELMYTESIASIYFPSWQFQYSIPNLWSEYKLITDKTNYQFHLVGTLPLSKHESLYEGKRQRWVMQNIQAFKSEPLMPSKNVYLASLSFSSKGWVNIHFDLLENEYFFKTVSDHKFLKPIAEKLVDGLESPDQKIKAISDYIKQSVTWNEVNDFLSDSPKKVLEQKTGTAADINLLLGSMLDKVGFDVTLVLLSTRDHGFVMEDFPSFSQFNYVVCLITIDGKDILLDATEKKLPYDLLPERCFNHKGFYVSNEGFGWIGIEPFAKDKIAITAKLVMEESGGFTGSAHLALSGYAAYSFRNNDEADQKTNLKRYFSNGEWSISEETISGVEDVEKPLTADCNLKIDDLAIVNNNLIFFNPHFFLKDELNPFVAESRIYPVDFGKMTEKIVILTIDYPKNYVVDELPKNKIFALPSNAGKAVFNYTQVGNRLTITSHILLNKTLFTKEEYLILREFYNLMIAKKSETIVLKKPL